MNVSEIFIRRPIATSLIMLGIAGMGVVSYSTLPVSDLPNVDLPTLNVTASLPGADPSTMASAVATPLERQFTTIAGLDEMTSSSSAGSTNITLQFDLDRHIDGAAVDVQTAIAAVMPLLPPGMPAPPSFRKFNPADQPVMFLDLYSDTVPMSVLNDYAETLNAPRIATVPGVSQVQVNGVQKYAVRVQVDPNKLRAQAIGLNEVSQALQNWNVNLPTGQLFARDATHNLRATGQLMNAEAFRSLVVAYRNGAPIRLQQVAQVIDSVEDNRQAAWLFTRDSQRRAIFLSAMRQPGSNTIDISDRIQAVMPSIEAQLPPTVHLTTPQSGFDRSKQIREAFTDIRWTMVATMVLVVAVIFIFLHSASATMIPALALPFSLLGTLAVMRVLDYSLDNLSMMALILSIGFVVDDAIVMLENIVRHIEQGEPPLEAAVKGSREIGFTILSMTVSLAAVFIPILFMSGVLGRLFREFAVTITAAVLISGLVSITLTPMLCSRFLRAASLHGKGRLARLLERSFEKLFSGYAWSLGLVLRHRIVMLVVFLAVLVSAIRMYAIVPKGLIPDQDNDLLRVNIQAAQGTSYYEMRDHVFKIAPILTSNPNIAEMFVNTGGSFASMNSASFGISLLPRAERSQSVQEILQQVRPRVANFPGFRATLSIPPTIQIGGRQQTGAFSLTVRSANTDELYEWTNRLEAALGGLRARGRLDSLVRERQH
jgi:HAE1 family hydrophobic/amphiphilic exporter-1